ncbi:MAG: hypothetical protein ACTHK3_03560 [Solirubrobacterales bacterium]
MRPRALAVLILAIGLLGVALAPASAGAAPPQPAWTLSMSPIAANFAPGAKDEYLITATNVGSAPTDGSQVTVQATLPSGLKLLSASVNTSDRHRFATQPTCEAPVGQSVSCGTGEALHPGHHLLVSVLVEVLAAEGEGLTALASVQGGGAAAASAEAPTPIGAEPVPFGFLGPFAAPADQPDGSPAVLAGSHPYQLTVDLNFPTERFASSKGESGELEVVGVEHPRDLRVDLPRGLLGNPAATPIRCTEADLENTVIEQADCPAASQIGTIGVTTSLSGGLGNTEIATAPLYNMVPPPGVVAEFGFNLVEIGLFVHLVAGVRTESDYGAYTASNDLLALGNHPFYGVKTQIWGDPSAEAHNWARGLCFSHTNDESHTNGECPPEGEGRTPFLTLPADCPGHPQRFEASVDSWENPGVFKTAEYESADLEGNPVSTSGCNAEPFEPTIEARPTTDQADSPTGLEVDLRQPQQGPVGEGQDPLQGRASAPLKDARVTLPAGMAVNPSQADGLAACTEEEIGYLSEDEEAGIHFSNDPNTCPDASKLGRIEVSSPVLAEYKEEGTEVVTDPETGAPIPRPLKGSVYLAKPFDNPLGSLLAIYLAVEDPRSGIVAKLAGKVEADPLTGQLTTVFEENPELPLSDIHLSLFNGARAPLITPIACGAHTTTTTLTPWSTPEGADAHPTDSFQVTGEPGGGACPSSEAGAANAPSLDAGTLNPQAGAYSPFVLKLHREDGSQRLTGIDTTLPPGLSGKLAGIAECSEAQIAQAKSREAPNLGQAEKESPSCPLASEVGVVKVAAGAGPSPFWTQGHAYLAGPYKGAPLSLAVIVPAVAGPFDLGSVVSRVALHVDEETAQIHAVSDPLPTILDGIPLDLRTVVLEMGRPGFTLNPTNCSPMSVLATTTSSLGAAASLSNPFQVGDCQSLGFKPHLKISLTGATKRSGNPALKAVLTMPPGGANVARAQVGLPHALFIDQANLNKVCTQANLHAATCPASSVYGHARAISPLLDAPLEGPVYLGVGYGHKLPDLVADLNGQIRVLLHGKIDTTKQDGIRNTFEVVPDAPVSKFTLSMKGGKKYSLIENSESLCAKPQKASALFVAQNGRVDQFTTRIAVKCPHHPKHKRHHKGRR